MREKITLGYIYNFSISRMFINGSEYNVSNFLLTFESMSTESRKLLLESYGYDSLDDLLSVLKNEQLRNLEQIIHEYAAYRAHHVLFLYIPPFILLFGTFGNIFSFVFMRQESNKQKSTYTYLAALAIMDSVVLYVGLLRTWIGEMVGYDIRDQTTAMCVIVNFLGSASSCLSAWLIVAVTVERYIVVVYPLKAKKKCSVKAAKMVIGALLGIAVFVNIHLVWSVGLNERSLNGIVYHTCDGIRQFRYFLMNIWPWLDTIMYCLGPFLVLLVLNILISRRVFLSKNKRKRELCAQPSANRSRANSPYHLTAMLLVVSHAHLFTTLPMTISITISNVAAKNQNDYNTMTKLMLFNAIAQMLMYVNHSINFYLYCASGERFRRFVMRCFKAWRSFNTRSSIRRSSQRRGIRRSTTI